jgi:oligopeptide/dipeptide ABC transporter ATP-binding protein
MATTESTLPPTADQPAPILRVEQLAVHFPIRSGLLRRQVGAVRAVDGVSFEIHKGETFGLVGESGCGKTTAARAIVQVVKATGGRVYFHNTAMDGLHGRELRRARRGLQMIFQDPYASLDPRMTVGDSIAEPIEAYDLARGPQLKARVEELMQMVRLDPAAATRYPHEFSGGQNQRVGVARALSTNPEIIICDEAVSALDVSIQAQVLNLLTDLQGGLNLTLIFIAHDLKVIRYMADRIAVMYLGQVVELAPTDRLFAEPSHPYTRALVSAVPLPDPIQERRRERIILTGEIPSPANPPSGCRFHTRCWFRTELGRPEKCVTEAPKLRAIKPGHEASCHFAEELISRGLQPRIKENVQ